MQKPNKNRNPLRKLKIFSKRRLKWLRRMMMNRSSGISQDTQKIRVTKMHRRERIKKFGPARQIAINQPEAREMMEKKLVEMREKKLTENTDA